MNLIQEILNILERKEHKKTLELKKDWFEFGRTRKSSVGNPLYTPKMTPHAIRFDDLKCQIISGLVEGTGTEHTLPMWSTVNQNNCNVQTIVDSIFSQDAGATEGLVSGKFRVTGNTVLEGDLLVLGQQTIVESTVVQVADNIMRINSGGAGVDAGIEVIQPSGTKTWAWDAAQGLWSTFGNNIRTEDIFINGAIHQDGESLVNVVNEAEGLASQDNDNSLATVAAIIDWSDQMDLDVSADTGTPLDILLNSETLQIRGGSNITTNADGNETIRIDLDDDIVVNSVTSNSLTLNGAPGPLSVDAIVNDITIAVNEDSTLPTVRALKDYVDTQRDYVQTVALNGTSLDFNGVGNAFGGSVDLSSIAGGGSALTGGDLITVSNGVIDHDTVSVLENNPSTITMGYGLNLPRKLVGSNITHDGHGHITQYWAEQLKMPDWLGLTNVVLNGTDLEFTSTAAGIYGGFSGSVDLSSLAGTGADGYVSSVVLNGTDLEFTSVGNGFSGSVPLATLLDDTNTTYDLDSLQVGNDVAVTLVGSDASLDTITLVAGTNITLTDDGSNNITIDAAGGSSSYTFGTYLTETSGTVNHDATTRTNTSSTDSPAHGDTFTVVDDIVTNATGHVEIVNTKTITLPSIDACADGMSFQNLQQALSGQWQIVGLGVGFPMGFSNSSGQMMQYALTFTLQFAFAGTPGVKGFNVKLVANSQTSPILIHQWDDSNYFVNELSSSHTWTFVASNITANTTIEVQIQGDTGLTIETGHLAIVGTSCSANLNGTIQLLPAAN